GLDEGFAEAIALADPFAKDADLEKRLRFSQGAGCNLSGLVAVSVRCAFRGRNRCEVTNPPGQCQRAASDGSICVELTFDRWQEDVGNLEAPSIQRRAI